MNKKDLELYKDIPLYQKEMLKDFRSKHPYNKIDINGIRWNFISCGKGGDVLLLFHGWFVNAHMWFHQILEFENEFSIIVPTFPLEVTKKEELIAGVMKILEVEKVEKVILIGISAGGAWAQYFLREYPEKVKHLILSHTGIPSEDVAHRVKKRARILRLLPFFLVRRLLKRFSRRNIRKYPDSTWNKFLRAYFHEIGSNITKKMLLSQIASNVDFSPNDELKPEDFRSWNGNTLILSTIDDESSFDKVDELRALHPGSQVHIFNRGGHHIFGLFPEEYNAAIRNFLKELS